MDESGLLADLPLPVSLNTVTTHYQLVEIGAVRSPQANHLEPEALVYFSPIQQGTCAAADAERIQQPIPMQLAPLLVPGTVWTANGMLVDEGMNTYPGRRQLVLGKQAPDLCRLADLFPLESSCPVFLQRACPDAWYTVIKGRNEQLLVPCFELLRSFCYQEAGSLSNFLFSRLPLDALCWPIAAPTSGNDFTAHLCVAAESLRRHEAIVLAELLFNAPYRASIEQAHLHLAATWHAHETNRQVAQAFAKVSLQLGRNVKATASGVAFTVGKQNYFWISRLLPSPTWHAFKKVVYHPLGDRSRNRTPLSSLAQPAFRDILHGRRPTPKMLLAAGLPESFRQFGRGLRPKSFTATQVAAIESFQWATRIPMQQQPVFADPNVVNHLWARPGYAPIGKEARLPANPFFEEVCTHLRDLGCSVKLLEINNPGRRFGQGRSIFPYSCAPHPSTHLPDGRYRPLSIACIQWGGGYFYAINCLDSKRLILFYQKNLKEISTKEMKSLLLTVVDQDFHWQHIARHLPYTNTHDLIVFELVFGVAWLSESIHLSLKHAVSYYNQAVEFFRQIENLYLSNTMSDSAQLKLIDEIRTSIDKIQYPGNQIGEAFERLK